MRMRCNSTSKSSHLYCYLVVMDITRSSMADSTMRVKVRYRLLSSDKKNFAQTKWCEKLKRGTWRCVCGTDGAESYEAAAPRNRCRAERGEKKQENGSGSRRERC